MLYGHSSIWTKFDVVTFLFYIFFVLGYSLYTVNCTDSINCDRCIHPCNPDPYQDINYSHHNKMLRASFLLVPSQKQTGFWFLSLSILFFFSLWTLLMQSYHVYSFVSGFFHSVKWFWGSPILWGLSVVSHRLDSPERHKDSQAGYWLRMPLGIHSSGREGKEAEMSRGRSEAVKQPSHQPQLIPRGAPCDGLPGCIRWFSGKILASQWNLWNQMAFQSDLKLGHILPNPVSIRHWTWTASQEEGGVLDKAVSANKVLPLSLPKRLTA